MNKRINILQAVGCALLITALFSWRWHNCLPFSGYMPTAANHETLGFYGRYLIYAQEPFSFPLGVVKRLSFPLQAANIMRGPIPLFAIPLKGLSKIFPPLAEFYYFVLVELLCVFLAALFAWGLAREFNAKSFWSKLLAASLSGLSVTLLHKSSQYFGTTFHVMYAPLYLGCAYAYVRLYKYRDWKAWMLLVCMFISAALTCYYAFFAITAGMAMCVAIHGCEMLFKAHERRRIFVKTIPVITALVIGVVAGVLCAASLGNNSNLEKVNKHKVLHERWDTEWGYGGGYGGGFHVADVLSIVIPPKDSDDLPAYKRCGPTAYLARLRFPVTTADLQPGQYEGFNYTGTIPLGLWLAVIIVWVAAIFRSRRMVMTRWWLHVLALLRSSRDNDVLARSMGLSVLVLYVISWGYIIHVAGHRLNNVLTPSFVMACLEPQFMLSRSLGRFALPLSMFVVLSSAVLFERHIGFPLLVAGKRGRIAFAILVLILVVAHINEVSGYLRPTAVTKGNEIANTFCKTDVKTIKEVARDKKAFMVNPAFNSSMEWTRTCYALAYYGNIPVSGSTIGPPGESEKDLCLYASDVDDVSAGRIRDIVKRYGNVCIASTSNMAETILSRSDLPLKPYRLISRDCWLLTVE